jgi:hypothetical protein
MAIMGPIQGSWLIKLSSNYLWTYLVGKRKIKKKEKQKAERKRKGKTEEKAATLLFCVRMCGREWRDVCVRRVYVASLPIAANSVLQSINNNKIIKTVRSRVSW